MEYMREGEQEGGKEEAQEEFCVSCISRIGTLPHYTIWMFATHAHVLGHVLVPRSAAA